MRNIESYDWIGQRPGRHHIITILVVVDDVVDVDIVVDVVVVAGTCNHWRRNNR